MLRDPSVKYRPFPAVDLPDRQWPGRTITKAPRWLSTDMRDGNQALIDPMDGEKKQRFFDLLRYVEKRLPEAGFVLGERYSLVDAYLAVFFLWARRFELPVAELPRYSRLVGAVLPRPAVRRALEQEGFGHLYAA